ncbi:3-deoxy-D-manno-octulosonic acid transferase [Halioglobus sp. HI00S01]|uniref:lipid IV(A) 3-deoxy-D-manno-octulosonic acid transferase n=1 Tax=Halioglobus sp. HI00S01 TaxID=1822214 RepID=UPI0007C37599|nr:lipid IV(A) 3-deoxy-D-manno-octulosonic acid transferase [Halioglobus sp. HI00S01]KZX58189.1 3-deoxy-D-manno-octulosonic acid transferase [Halioglobus sp. HI00S01]
MRYVYSALFYLLLPFILLRMLLRSRRAPVYRQRLAERFGWFAPRPDLPRTAVWVHAVSVGETLAAAPLIEHLLQRYPEADIVVTTTTPTGSDRVRSLFGERVFHVYSPWDMPGAVARFFARVKPGLLVVMETELWPNLLHHAQRNQCPVILANARLSARSARGYQRVAGLTAQMMQQLTLVACQSRADGERFVQLGLAADRLQVTGSIKFDIDLDNSLRAEATALKSSWPNAPVLLGSSTHPGEDELLLQALGEVREHHPNALLLLVPRHPERFDGVAALCAREGFNVVRRSSGRPPEAGRDVYLGDTMGELRLLSGVADIAVIGGSFIQHGGQNVLEAAAWGVPVVSGPHMFNFTEITELLTTAGAMRQVADGDELGRCLMEILAAPNVMQAMGEAGEQVVAENRGALARLTALVDERVPGA